MLFFPPRSLKGNVIALKKKKKRSEIDLLCTSRRPLVASFLRSLAPVEKKIAKSNTAELAPAESVTTRPRPLVLIAEDNPVNQGVMQAMLERLMVDSDIASDGQEVVDKFLKGNYYLILMDMNMPLMNGMEASMAIRAAEEKASQATGEVKHVPIVATTASVTAQDRDGCLQAGMDDFLSKPIRFLVLQEMLKRYDCL